MTSNKRLELITQMIILIGDYGSDKIERMSDLRIKMRAVLEEYEKKRDEELVEGLAHYLEDEHMSNCPGCGSSATLRRFRKEARAAIREARGEEK